MTDRSGLPLLPCMAFSEAASCLIRGLSGTSRLALPIVLSRDDSRLKILSEFLGQGFTWLENSEVPVGMEEDPRELDRQLLELLKSQKLLLSPGSRLLTPDVLVAPRSSSRGLLDAARMSVSLKRSVLLADDKEDLASLVRTLAPEHSVLIILDEKAALEELFALSQFVTGGPSANIGFFFHAGASDFPLLKLIQSASVPFDAEARSLLYMPKAKNQPQQFERLVVTGVDNLAAKEAAQFLQEKLNCLLIEGHSNGIDSDFGPLVLCSKASKIGPLSEGSLRVSSSALPCFHSNQCNRISSGKELFAPDELKARVLFLSSCHSFLMRGGLYQPEIGLWRAFAEAPYVQAMVGHCGRTSTEIEAGLVFLEHLSTGATIGEATACANDFLASSESRSLYMNPLVLWGDPAWRSEKFESGVERIFNQEGRSDLVEVLLPRRAAYRRRGTRGGDTSPLIPKGFFDSISYACMLIGSFLGIDSSVEQHWGERALKAVFQLRQIGVLFNQAGRRGDSAAPIRRALASALSTAIKSYHSAIMDFIAEFVRVGPSIRALGGGVNSEQRSISLTHCPYCEQVLVKRFVGELEGLSEPRVMLAVCETCGILETGVASIINARIGYSVEEGEGKRVLNVGLTGAVSLQGAYLISACALLEQFDRRLAAPPPRGDFQSIEEFVSTGTQLDVEISIVLPDSFVRGVYSIVMCLALNEQTHFLSCPVVID